MQGLYFMACTVPNLYSSFLSPKTPMRKQYKMFHFTFAHMHGYFFTFAFISINYQNAKLAHNNKQQKYLGCMPHCVQSARLIQLKLTDRSLSTLNKILVILGQISGQSWSPLVKSCSWSKLLRWLISKASCWSRMVYGIPWYLPISMDRLSQIFTPQCKGHDMIHQK